MNISTRSIALTGAIAFALALSSAPALASEDSPEISNARMESQIWTTYALNPNLRASDLQITVLDGKATLSGIVEEDINRDLAEQVALGVDGVTAVDNQIEVKAEFRPVARVDERLYGAKIDDASTSAAVRSKLSWSQRTGDHPAEVDTVDGKVTLTGNADSAEDKAFVTRLAMNTPGVRSVDNQMLVVSQKAGEAQSMTHNQGAFGSQAAIDNQGSVDNDKVFYHQDAFGSQAAVDNLQAIDYQATLVDPAKPRGAETPATAAVSDSWITTKVNSTFMHSSNVNSSNIVVSTLHGVVTLSGSVGTDLERALAIELAENVRGVETVESSGLALSVDEVAGVPMAQ